MSANFNCSYMARSSLTYIPGFFCEIFLSADIYRLCKLGIFWYKITFKSSPKPLNQICVWWSRPLTKMAAQLYLVLHRTLWEIHIKTILSGTSSSIKTKLRWNSHWMVLLQNGFRQLRSPTKMAATVQLRCYWKQLWSRWAITGSWEPLVS
jgi:hypothetical protein